MEGSFETTTTAEHQTQAEAISHESEADNVGEDNVKASQKQKKSTKTTSGKAPRKALAVKKKRERRPYKKLAGDVLSSRICEFRKKINFMKEKLAQLDERCKFHERELELRDSESSATTLSN